MMAAVSISRPWPWYVAGPLIGLFVPLLLLIGNRLFGISSSLRHLCAATLPGRLEYLRYDWKKSGLWNLAFTLGILAGGFLAAQWDGAKVVAISPATHQELAKLGIHDFSGLAPRELFHWSALRTLPGLVLILGGGFLVGFGSAYAGGCTSGHAISGLADVQLPSLLAVMGFFLGGWLATHWVLRYLL
jgi:uncharacterized protein